MPGSPRSKTSFKTSRVSVSVQFKRPPRSFWFGSALLVFLISSWIAFWQEPCPKAYAYERMSPLYTSWWLYPLESNASQRLLETQADLNDVFALQGTGHVWVVGNG